MYNEQEKARVRTILDVHIGKQHQAMPVREQLRMLSLRKRRLTIIAAVNILALVFFGYWFFSGITELASWVFWMIVVVFTLNLASVSHQRRQITLAADFLESGGTTSAESDKATSSE